MSVRKTVLESKNWMIQREFLDYDVKHYSIILKNPALRNESIIVTEEQLKELLSFNECPLEV